MGSRTAPLLCVLIAGLLWNLSRGKVYQLLALVNSINASITSEDYQKLNTNLMDVISTNTMFHAAYRDASDEQRDRVISQGKSYGLTDDEAMAVMIYTDTSVNGEFNMILRDGIRHKYDIPQRVLHYNLISALEKLLVLQILPRFLYRGDPNSYQSLSQGDKVQLAGFTSAVSGLKVANRVRKNGHTLFVLKGVVFGAAIKKLSLYPQEAEILIPPYETFRITRVTKDDRGPVIELTSIGETCVRKIQKTGCQCCRQSEEEIFSVASQDWGIFLVGVLLLIFTVYITC
ncbi:ecto-ADP-ribosyltransferase 5-like [Haliotis rubra]|uniref:ecto-ADP-ribosyltransferase 5-like n=1 Tax=Haliotis rubra TaxID=36100 RepID=UPI001EE52FEE|nr:ecto-ADP-ribosyltransferase 5-like [Haliotis rubra]